MLRFIIRRVLIACVTVFAISVVSFVIIQLPPGDFLTAYAAQLAQQGDTVPPEQLQALRDAYGLGQPVYVQYAKWVSGVLRGDFGQSLEWGVPVNTLIWDRMGMTIIISASTILFVWVFAIPVGVFSATHQYSLADYFFTFLGFLGLAIPDFMLALVLMWVGFSVFHQDVLQFYFPVTFSSLIQ